ncbi:gamma-glutamylcyclotransferase [Haloarcula sp. S1CR25-12]|uniref:Gamma-glutamylcyclotransferase n=1 Tax=Haloarcula saliterrae TaxID=2950534 RepID=A0ABU2FID6_9EURY|nr:gamma-glutamylcyclotransferase family protein [Haloarcula sp. S1CR25-12]MDS0261470.1 gamma-glutamylcyclotransferase [Haloarcula sp. S1CR25-12]
MDVFVYGTLTEPSTARRVLDRFAFRGDAELDGLHRVEGRYPTLAPGGTCEGRILRTPDSDALDRYEGVDRGLYCRLAIPLADSGTVECYVGDPSALGASAAWPGSGPFADRVEQYCRSHDVVVELAGSK